MALVDLCELLLELGDQYLLSLASLSKYLLPRRGIVGAVFLFVFASQKCVENT